MGVVGSVEGYQSDVSRQGESGHSSFIIDLGVVVAVTRESLQAGGGQAENTS